MPLLGFIGRLDFQKGPDVVLEAVGDLAARGLQVSDWGWRKLCQGLALGHRDRVIAGLHRAPGLPEGAGCRAGGCRRPRGAGAPGEICRGS